ncbi:polysaccharide biosynthesis/export family protein [Asaia bogorensis]|uniref:Capsular polysaccharide biosynthesis protein n=1 Tax=Asaia bogorensis NBRC 16594 TaxID=1231624 RepID=A0AAN4R4W8_9PROT|nr:polysaccharide biosynthesis/export family protein [Asaia bogorensis]BAT18807.1 polysaccharide export protein [Asaia bogorensis NBRC 16594]GBQ77253.1 polysaccharide export protein [Asaia bogorensis NBRC 16594]GEL53161.1 capsular polysaccharide biosynthesis protein [Asaia bogorensis NBRC 16594]
MANSSPCQAHARHDAGNSLERPIMRIPPYHLLLSLAAGLSLAACTMPEAGPSVKALKKTPDVTIIPATRSLVDTLAQSARTRRDERLRQALSAIRGRGSFAHDHKLGVGDTIHVGLWIFSQGAGQEGDVSSAPGPTVTDIGTFSVASDGTITLPYVHKVRVVGMSVPHAQEVLTRAYQKLGTMQNPAVALTSGPATGESADSDGIIVTGATGRPIVLPWNAGGVTMARALTAAMGDGTTVFSAKNNAAGDHADASVSVSRHNQTIARLPMLEALEQDIPLRPGDHLIVRHDASVRVTTLGGGITHNTLLGFSESPTLIQVIAAAQGLNVETANDREIFVLRRTAGTVTPILYVFPMHSGDGLITAQRFPIEDEDVVYVGEAPIVPVERVITTFLQLGLIAAVAR